MGYRVTTVPDHHRITSSSRLPSWIPVLIAVILCLLFAAFLTWRIQRNLLTESDELLTAERSREMLLSGLPWTVTFNFQPSFNKPPLQYWCAAAILPLWQAREVSVRFWPLLHAMAAVVGTGWLAWVLDRRKPWLIPLSVALLLTCQSFMHEAGTARLDVGLTALVTLAVGAILCAHRRPRDSGWLIVAALACSLASLQKNPLGLLCWLVLIVGRKIVRSDTPANPAANAFARRETSWFVLAAIASSLWPLVQIVGYGMPMAQTFGYSEMAVVTGPTRLGGQPYFYLLSRLVAYWMWGAFVLLAATYFLIRGVSTRGSRQPAATRRAAGLSLLCLAVITLATLAGFRSVRYILLIFPCLCVLGALALHRVLEIRSLWLRLPVCVLSVGCLVVDSHHLWSNFSAQPPDVSPQYRTALALGEMTRRAGSQARCVVVRHEEKFDRVLYGSFYLFYGNLTVPVEESTLEWLHDSELSPPVVGVCERRDLQRLRDISPRLVVQEEHGDFVCWEVSGAK